MAQSQPAPESKPLSVVLGENLYWRRVKRIPKMSQPALAALSGVALNTIMSLESARDPAWGGKRHSPKLGTLERLASALGCTVIDLLVEDKGVSLRGRPSGSPDLVVLPGAGGDTISAVQSPTVSIVRPPPVPVS
jgi:transcriptional regulator with XRE-family HTH domain